MWVAVPLCAGMYGGCECVNSQMLHTCLSVSMHMGVLARGSYVCANALVQERAVVYT